MLSTNVHPADHELLMGLDGESSDAAQAVVQAHVAVCARCRDRWISIHETLTETGELYTRQFGTPASIQSGRDRLEGALDALSDRGSRRAGFVAPLPRVAAAAALSVALAIVWIAGSRGWSSHAEMDGRIAVAGALPNASLTPGAVAIASADVLCAGVRPMRVVADEARRQVLRSYRMEAVPEREYELDALITPELGGSVDVRNLWPQRYDSPVWSARVKDELERLLPDLVCRGEIDLTRAQRDIAADWVAAYKTYFKTNQPLRAHLGPPIDDHDLEIAPPQYALADVNRMPALLVRLAGRVK